VTEIGHHVLAEIGCEHKGVSLPLPPIKLLLPLPAVTVSFPLPPVMVLLRCRLQPYRCRLRHRSHVAVARDQAVIAVAAVHRSRYTTDEARQNPGYVSSERRSGTRYDSISLESW
jgi:hypothetical protein